MNDGPDEAVQEISLPKCMDVVSVIIEASVTIRGGAIFKTHSQYRRFFREARYIDLKEVILRTLVQAGAYKTPRE